MGQFIAHCPRRKMLRYAVILLLQLIFVSVCHGQPLTVFPQHSALKSVNSNDQWTILEDTRIGYKSRINVSRGQDPFPFCFSVAATLLWDQHRCQHDNKDCSQQLRTSFLSVTSYGQQLPITKLKVADGGSALISLSKIVEQGGSAAHNVCHYDYIEKYRQPQQFNLSGLQNTGKEWKKYKDFTPYMERFYRRIFFKSLYEFNPYKSHDDAMALLKSAANQTSEQFFASVLLNPECFENEFIPDNRFEIDRLKMGDVFDIKLTFDTIDRLLKKNTPVLITFCVNPEAKVAACVKHAAIVIAKAKAVNQVTKDVRTAYWIANTWGEDWQSVHNDGWIFAENFIGAAFGEIIWLKKK